MTKFFLIFLLTIFLFFSSGKSVLAQSSYVLPYPGAMPGSFLYKPRLILGKVAQFWYFGNFGQFAYNLKQSDKYLVEAKTLFEYKQYLLAYKALEKSDEYFVKTLPNLDKAKKEGKNITQSRQVLFAASKKHIEVLTLIENQVPEKFAWQPEKVASLELDLKATILSSIKLRNKRL